MPNKDVDSQEQEVEQANEVEAKIKEAFDESVAQEQDEDSTKMAMVGAGATFKNVTRLFNQFMIDAGLAISKADRDTLIEESLTGKALESEEEFNAAVEAVVAAVTGSTERSAAALVRAYAKKNELGVYTKPKGTGTGRSSFASDFYAFLSEAKKTEEEIKAYVLGEGDHKDTSANTKKNLSHYLAIGKMAIKIWG